MKLNGQVALVTGASRGIGRAVAIKLASQGAFVYVNYAAREDAAEETLKLCKEVGGDGSLMAFNVADNTSIEVAIGRIQAEKSRLDILVNNAGISKDGLFIRLKDEDWVKTIETNLGGAFYCSRAAAKIMMKARYGRIINVSSVVGEMGNVGQVPYSASKAGILGLTKSLARELASRNITVNAITPGFIDTDMTAAIDEKFKAEYLKNIPLGRFGQAEEVASLVAFIASSESSYITGQVIGINGGMYM